MSGSAITESCSYTAETCRSGDLSFTRHLRPHNPTYDKGLRTQNGTVLPGLLVPMLCVGMHTGRLPKKLMSKDPKLSSPYLLCNKKILDKQTTVSYIRLYCLSLIDFFHRCNLFRKEYSDRSHNVFSSTPIFFPFQVLNLDRLRKFL